MNRAQTTRVVACLGIGLLVAAGTAGGQSARLPDQIAQHEQKLAVARTAQKTKDVVVELNILAALYRQSGQTQKALDYCNQALPIDKVPATAPARR